MFEPIGRKYEIVESYRNAEGKPRQRHICMLQAEPLSEQLAWARHYAEQYRQRAETLQKVYDAIGDWQPPEYR
jgi:hypothetical protein